MHIQFINKVIQKLSNNQRKTFKNEQKTLILTNFVKYIVYIIGMKYEIRSAPKLILFVSNYSFADAFQYLSCVLKRIILELPIKFL